MKLSNVCFGRPEKGSRSPAEERCYDFLDQLGLAYLRLDHDVAPTMESLLPVEQALGCGIAKNLFLTNRQQTDFYLLIMPGHKAFKTKYLSAQLGCSRLSFATEEHLRKLLGVNAGCASILALLNDPEKKVRLVLDEDLKKENAFACHPCMNSSTLKLGWKDLQESILPALEHEPSYVELPSEMD